MTILSGVVPIIIMLFPRILILVQNILIYLLEILHTILLASVPGLPRSVRVLIVRRRQTFENRGRPGLKYHVR